MNELQQKAQERAALQDQWMELHNAHVEKMDHPIEVVEKMQQLNSEMSDLGVRIDQLKAIEQTALEIKRAQDYAGMPVDNIGHGMSGDRPDAKQGQRKSIGTAFVESADYKGWASRRPNQNAVAELESLGFKTTFDTSGSTFTGYDRQPNMVMVGTQRLTVADLLAKGQTTQNTIRYPQEDTFTNAATTVAEGSTKPEAAFDTSEQDAPVRKIAVTAKVTDELFMDFPALRDYIDERLPFMVRLTEEAQLLNGDGNSPNLKGILQFSGVQTQARGSDSNEDALYKAITKVRFTGFFEPDGVVLNPNNWQTIRLHTTTDGIYIWGSPSEAGPERVWGLPVVATTSITANTGLVGAYKLGAQVFYRLGITIESTNSNSDDFVKNLITLRAEQREALAVYRPAAFCKVTSMN